MHDIDCMQPTHISPASHQPFHFMPPPQKKKQGWMEDRVQVLPLPDPAAYSEAKWVAYMR